MTKDYMILTHCLFVLAQPPVNLNIIIQYCAFFNAIAKRSRYGVQFKLLDSSRYLFSEEEEYDEFKSSMIDKAFIYL